MCPTATLNEFPLSLRILLFTFVEVGRPLVHTVTKARTSPISNCCW